MNHFEIAFSNNIIKYRWWLIVATLALAAVTASGMRFLTFENDLLLGLRLGINDAAGTEFLAGLSHDLDNEGNVLRFEMSRRITDNVKIFLEGWNFFDIEPDDYYLYGIRDDDFVRLQIFYYF